MQSITLQKRYTWLHSVHGSFLSRVGTGGRVGLRECLFLWHSHLVCRHSSEGGSFGERHPTQSLAQLYRGARDLTAGFEILSNETGFWERHYFPLPGLGDCQANPQLPYCSPTAPKHREIAGLCRKGSEIDPQPLTWISDCSLRGGIPGFPKGVVKSFQLH